MASLIRKQAGEPFVVPSMREVPLKEQSDAFSFGQQLLAGGFDCIILLTGVGTRILWNALVSRYDATKLKKALSSVTKVARGPKASAALREIGLAPDLLVPEPNTWRELLETMRPRTEMRLALQEYGESNDELIGGLRKQGREVTPVRVYGWDLPEDTGPLRQAAAKLIAGDFDVVLFTTSMQVTNLLRIAESEGIGEQVKESLGSAFIGSIGPTTTRMLEEYGLRPDFEPTHPKMGILVNEAAGHASDIVRRKL